MYGSRFLWVLFFLSYDDRLGGVGLLMILGNFAPSLLIYRVLSGYRWGVI